MTTFTLTATQAATEAVVVTAPAMSASAAARWAVGTLVKSPTVATVTVAVAGRPAFVVSR